MIDTKRGEIAAGNQFDRLIDCCVEYGLYLPITLAHRQQSYAVRTLAMVFNVTLWLPMFIVIGAPTVVLIVIRLFIGCIED